MVPDGCQFLYDAYRDLVTCRPPEGAIPWDKVALYADKRGLDEDTAELLWNVIRQMDIAERQWVFDNPAVNTEGRKPDG